MAGIPQFHWRKIGRNRRMSKGENEEGDREVWRKEEANKREIEEDYVIFCISVFESRLFMLSVSVYIICISLLPHLHYSVSCHLPFFSSFPPILPFSSSPSSPLPSSRHPHVPNQIVCPSLPRISSFPDSPFRSSRFKSSASASKRTLFVMVHTFFKAADEGFMMKPHQSKTSDCQ